MTVRKDRLSHSDINPDQLCIIQALNSLKLIYIKFSSSISSMRYICRIVCALLMGLLSLYGVSSEYMAADDLTETNAKIELQTENHSAKDLRSLKEVSFWDLSSYDSSIPCSLHPSIPVLSTSSLIFENHLLNTTQRLFWDIFIKDLLVFFLIPRFGSNTLDITKFKFYFPEMNREFSLSFIEYRRYPWMQVEPEDVAVAFIQDPAVARYIASCVKRDPKHLIELQISIPVLGNLSKSFKIQSHSIIAQKIRHTRMDLIATTAVKSATTLPEVEEWLSYHQSIGVEHFVLYFFRQLHQESPEYIYSLNKIAKDCNFCFSIAQWHPYYVPGPHPYKSYVSSYVGFLFSILYRIKAPLLAPSIQRVIKTNDESHLESPWTPKDVYLAVLSTNNFLVVHSSFKDLKQMVLSYDMPSTSAIGFTVNYFYLVDKQTHEPANTTFLDSNALASNYIIHEAEVKDVRKAVIKMIYNTRNTLFPAANGNFQMTRSTNIQWSHSFVLNYMRPALCRNICILKYPSPMKDLHHFTVLPRSYNATNDCPMYLGEVGPGECTNTALIHDYRQF